MTDSFYCINCQQDIRYTPVGDKVVFELMRAYSIHNETCVGAGLSANLGDKDKAQFMADRILKLADKMEKEKK